MEIDPNFSSLLRTLRVDEPWVPPKTWESIPSESGRVRSADSCGQSQDPIYESSLISVSQFLGNYNSLLAILPFHFFGNMSDTRIKILLFFKRNLFEGYSWGSVEKWMY